MSKGLVRSIDRAPDHLQGVVRIAKAGSATLAITGATGVGFGTAVLNDLPVGEIMMLALKLDFSVDEGGSADIVDTFDGDIGVGTTPLTDGTMTAGDVDLIASTTVAQAVAGVASGTVKSAAALTGTIFDNTAGALEINVNFLIDDADVSGDTGSLTMTYTLQAAFLVMD
jgi:hypothetical protein